MTKLNLRDVSALNLSAILGLGPLGVIAAQAEEAQSQTETQTEAQTVYGWQLMTPAERQEMRMQMRNARTQEERDQIRAENHAKMEERAKEQGVKLPDVPMGPGMGQGMGRGMGQGMGGGMGQGMGGGNR